MCSFRIKLPRYRERLVKMVLFDLLCSCLLTIVEQVRKHHVHEVQAFEDGVEGKGYCSEDGLEVAHLREQSRFNAQLFNERVLGTIVLLVLLRKLKTRLKSGY
jgi:hypothetical protein